MKFQDFQAQPVPYGPITGKGEDGVATFNFNGGFSPDAKQVRFVKQYYGKQNHAIYYQGDVIMNPPTITGFWGFSAGAQNGKFTLVFK